MLADRLCDEHTIERISMVRRQGSREGRVRGSHWHLDETVVPNLRYQVSIDLDSPEVRFDRVLT